MVEGAFQIPGLGADLEDLPWQATRVPGVAWIPLHVGELQDGASATPSVRPPATVLIRMEPGCGYGAHRHRGSEDVLVLQGGYEDERGRHETGAAVHYPPGSAHAPRALGRAGSADPACVLYAVAPEGIELLERPDRAGAPARGARTYPGEPER